MKTLLLVMCVSILLLAACAPAPTATSVAVLPTAIPTEVASAVPTITPTPTPAPTSTTTPTDTPTPTQTPTPVPTYTLSGVVFFDYNGNGVYDEHEPPISGATVQVGALTAVSAFDGSYTLQGVPAGEQEVRVSADGFRYISLSLQAFQSYDQPIAVMVDGDARRDWGLMQGFLTLPLKAGTRITRQYSYFDLDPGPGVRDWCNSGVTMNGHKGVRDYGLEEGEEIVAAAPGIVTEAVSDWQNSSDPSVIEDGNRVFINHGYGFETLYCHLLDVLVQEGDRVSRGQVIGHSGNTGTASGAPHLHFQLNHRGRPIDAYRDPQNPNSLCYWTKDNDPQYPP